MSQVLIQNYSSWKSIKYICRLHVYIRDTVGVLDAAELLRTPLNANCKNTSAFSFFFRKLQ